MAKSGISFRECEATFNSIYTDIKARKFAPIYLLMGEESYYIDKLSSLLENTILNDAEKAFNQIVIYGKDSDGKTVGTACRQLPMMGQYEVIIVKEAQQLDDLDLLSLYTENPNNSTILVLCYKGGTPDKRQSLYKTCKKNGAVFESVIPRDYEIRGWLSGFMANKGLKIDAVSIELLIGNIGCSISKIDNELNKLVVSLPQGQTTISSKDIEEYIGISKDYNNFELCSAVAKKDVRHALTIAQHLSANPKQNPLILTISALFGQFRQIFILNYLRWEERVKSKPFPAEGEAMGILKIGNAFAYKELKAIAPTWSNRNVFNILGLIRTYDAKSKGVDNGGQSDGELLRELLLKIFTLA